jgi:hypothetical protein
MKVETSDTPSKTEVIKGDLYDTLKLSLFSKWGFKNYPGIYWNWIKLDYNLMSIKKTWTELKLNSFVCFIQLTPMPVNLVRVQRQEKRMCLLATLALLVQSYRKTKWRRMNPHLPSCRNSVSQDLCTKSARVPLQSPVRRLTKRRIKKTCLRGHRKSNWTW